MGLRSSPYHELKQTWTAWKLRYGHTSYMWENTSFPRDVIAAIYLDVLVVSFNMAAGRPLSFASFESLGVDWLQPINSTSHLKTVTWECNFGPFPLPTYKEAVIQEHNYTCSAPPPTPSTKEQSCENATTLAQPLLPFHLQTVMWECSYTCSAPPPSSPTVMLKCNYICSALPSPSKQSCMNGPTLAQPLLPPHL